MTDADCTPGREPRSVADSIILQSSAHGSGSIQRKTTQTCAVIAMKQKKEICPQ